MNHFIKTTLEAEADKLQGLLDQYTDEQKAAIEASRPLNIIYNIASLYGYKHREATPGVFVEARNEINKFYDFNVLGANQQADALALIECFLDEVNTNGADVVLYVQKDAFYNWLLSFKDNTDPDATTQYYYFDTHVSDTAAIIADYYRGNIDEGTFYDLLGDPLDE